MKVSNNAGHTIKGTGSGAVGLLDESTCNRQISKYFVDGMTKLGNTIYDCTIEKSTSYLYEAVNKANKYNSDYAISHHLNHSDDPSANGVEVIVYSLKDKEVVKMAQKICDELAKLGMRNRGVKENSALYWLRKTDDKAMIIEYIFCSNKKDVGLYNPQKFANAVIKALTNQDLSNNITGPATTNLNKHQNGNYNCKGKVVKTNGDTLSVREDRDYKSKEIGKLKEGTILQVNYCKDNWFSTWHTGNEGYINGAYIELLK
ncbi:MAG: N-acetylmuramoyl-L-alanine amidase [Paraclostridium sp.]